MAENGREGGRIMVGYRRWTVVWTLSRRDKRTQPGVLTPGIRKKTVRPVGAVERGSNNQVANHYLGPDDLPPLQGGFMMLYLPGVKTPG